MRSPWRVSAAALAGTEDDWSSRLEGFWPASDKVVEVRFKTSLHDLSDRSESPFGALCSLARAEGV